MDTKQNGIIYIFGVNLRIFHEKNILLYVATTNVQGFIYYFGIFYLKIGKIYTFFHLGKGQVMGPKISAGKSLIPYLGINYIWKSNRKCNVLRKKFHLILYFGLQIW